MIEHPEAGRVDPIAGDVHAIWRDSHERCGGASPPPEGASPAS